MPRTLTVRLGAVLAATALVMTACGRDEEPASDAGDDTTETTAADGGGESAAFIDPEADCDDYQGTAGITGDTIKIGNVRPVSGNFAIFGKVAVGLDSFVTATNAAGGVKAGDGKTYKLELVSEDDAYDPAQTPAKVRKLVEQDQIFAMVGQIGTSNNLAVRQYMNDNCVPSISLATGATQWGEADDFPWFIGGLPSYAVEAANFVEYLKAEQPNAKIALIYQDDELGQSYKGGIEKAIEGTDITLVADQPYNPLAETSPESKVVELAGSGADVFFVGISGAPCPAALRAKPGTWTPLTYVNITCTSKTAMALAQGADEGILSSQATLDPANPEDQANPKVQEFRTQAAAAGMSADDIDGGITVAGWNFGATFVRALELSETIDRATVMNTLWSLQGENYGMLRDEVKINTDGADDPWLIEDIRIIKRSGGVWSGVTEMTSYEGKSNDLAG